ncbi:MAG: Gfo/Idh/MocA family oxidoreductase [bacterium]|nr:Gfo/Idh/MocA family oxidoreductase [bacterium]
MITFGIVGTGWRSIFYLRVAKACPDRFRVAGMVTRDPQKSALLGEEFEVPLFTSVEALIQKDRPHFMVTSVPWGVNPGAIEDLAERGMPVLSETPPATTLEELVGLWRLTEEGAKVQVAEQYWAQPHHAARIGFAQGVKLGQVSQAQVSAAHGYHGISLIRRYLGIGFEDAKVTARSFTSPIVQGPNRNGPPEGERVVDSKQAIAQFDFGDRLGVFDFVGDQYFSYVRGQRLLVRGERGEMVNDGAVYLQDFKTPVRVRFERHEAGQNGNLEGNYLKGIQAGESWVYKNPLAPGELTDDEIAVGTCLLNMGVYVEGGTPVYSLAEACQDLYLDILMAQALETGETVQSEAQAWAS